MSSTLARTTSSIIGLLVLAVAPTLAFAVDVAKWNTYDIKLTSGSSYANGYSAGPSTFNATFTGPDGVTQTVPGFWDGSNNFTIRFTPTVEGEWSYTTASSDATLNGQAGTINATPAVAGQHGFLRIDPVYNNSFVWDDGTRYFMEGQTYYDWMQAANVNDNWKTSVDSMLDYGFSKVRFDVYACNYPGETNNYADAQPYTGAEYTPDRDSLNLAYWRKLDEMVQYMDSKGLVADLIVTTPYHSYRQYGTDAQNDRFVKYVTARYAAYPNVIWCVANEWNTATGGSYPQDQADFNRMGGLIRTNDPWQTSASGAVRPQSIHSAANIKDLSANPDNPSGINPDNPASSNYFPFSTSNWLSYDVLQFHGARQKLELHPTSVLRRVREQFDYGQP